MIETVELVLFQQLFCRSLRFDYRKRVSSSSQLEYVRSSQRVLITSFISKSLFLHSLYGREAISSHRGFAWTFCIGLAKKLPFSSIYTSLCRFFVFSKTLCDGGVPQGSHLGPVLYLCVINDLPDKTGHCADIYADDTIIQHTLHAPDIDDYLLSLQTSITAAENWASSWHGRFGHSKQRSCPSANLLKHQYTGLSPWSRGTAHHPRQAAQARGSSLLQPAWLVSTHCAPSVYGKAGSRLPAIHGQRTAGGSDLQALCFLC